MKPRRRASKESELLMSRDQKRFWTAGRIIATAVVVALIATIGYTLLSSRARVKPDPRMALPGVSAPDVKSTPRDFDVPTIDGRVIRLSEYRGKVLVIDFWATWCPPCRKETQQLVRIANEKRDQGVEVIGLHIDDRGRSSPDDIRRFISQYAINYTIGLASDEMFISYLGAEDDTIPQTLVFGRDGKLVAHLIGYDESHARALDEAIARALRGT
jgi:thiol-disulfide isomerase/thioredoxin